MALEARWVPGYVTVAERVGPEVFANVQGISWTDIVGLRQGGGVTWRGKGGTSNWFHISVPTPVIDDDVRVRLERVFVLFSIDRWAQVQSVHVFDGPYRIATFDGLGISGNHSGNIDPNNNWAISGAPEVRWGIGITVGMEFGQEANLYFSGAGADFRS